MGGARAGSKAQEECKTLGKERVVKETIKRLDETQG